MKNPETARKQGESIRGSRNILYGKSGPLHPRFGKHHKLSEETKRRQREAFNSPEMVEARRKRMLAQQPLMNSPEVRAKREAAFKRLWSDPAYREAHRQRVIASWRKRKGLQ